MRKLLFLFLYLLGLSTYQILPEYDVYVVLVFVLMTNVLLWVDKKEYNSFVLAPIWLSHVSITLIMISHGYEIQTIFSNIIIFLYISGTYLFLKKKEEKKKTGEEMRVQEIKNMIFLFVYPIATFLIFSLILPIKLADMIFIAGYFILLRYMLITSDKKKKNLFIGVLQALILSYLFKYMQHIDWKFISLLYANLFFIVMYSLMKTKRTGVKNHY